MPTLDKEDPAKIFALFKGEPGTRKSTHAATFPGKQYWFSWDKKMNGILVPCRKWGIDMSQIDYDDYSDWNAPPTSGRKNALQKLDELVMNCPYNTLVFDSVTTLVDCILRQTLRLKGTQRKIGNISVNEQEDFNAESSALADLIAKAKDIQDYNYQQGKIINIILIAHVMDVTKTIDNRTTHVRTIVTAAKRIAARLPAYCSEVYHFDYEIPIVEGGDSDLIIYTQNTGDDFARTALNLDKKVKIGEKQLYRDHIKPAIEKLKKPTNDLTL